MHFPGSQRPSAYAKAGVDIDSGSQAVALMRTAITATHTPEVLAGVGAFGGMFDAARLRSMQSPVLVASIDGVGTKVMLAAQFGRFRSIGHDIVNHCVNDILAQGAEPLFFLDYFAAGKLNPAQAAEVVNGMAEACQAVGCALLGGETAEMPGVYASEMFDVAGAIVGVVERSAMLPQLSSIRPGDVLLGLRSSGPHTNGYSLIRHVLGGALNDSQQRRQLNAALSEIADEPRDIVEDLLAPHRCYLHIVRRIQRAATIKALAHITGGGFVDNLPRVLPAGLRADVDFSSWTMPPVFQLIQQRGNITDAEMRRVFNCGIGMVVIVSAEEATHAQASAGEECLRIGEVRAEV